MNEAQFLNKKQYKLYTNRLIERRRVLENTIRSHIDILIYETGKYGEMMVNDLEPEE